MSSAAAKPANPTTMWIRRPCPLCTRYAVMTLGDRPPLQECQSCGHRGWPRLRRLEAVTP